LANDQNKLILGRREYELANHLGNVLATVSDAKLPAAKVLSHTDYYAFGGAMPGRSGGNYRYGFNGKEDDAETGWQDYGMRLYHRGLGKFLSMDPLARSFPWNSPYAFAENRVINSIDLDGTEALTIDSRFLTIQLVKKIEAGATDDQVWSLANDDYAKRSYSDMEGKPAGSGFAYARRVFGVTEDVVGRQQPLEPGKREIWGRIYNHQDNMYYHYRIWSNWSATDVLLVSPHPNLNYADELKMMERRIKFGQNSGELSLKQVGNIGIAVVGVIATIITFPEGGSGGYIFWQYLAAGGIASNINSLTAVDGGETVGERAAGALAEGVGASRESGKTAFKFTDTIINLLNFGNGGKSLLKGDLPTFEKTMTGVGTATDGLSTANGVLSLWPPTQTDKPSGPTTVNPNPKQ
jgi:RHS repeat-associated protein